MKKIRQLITISLVLFYLPLFAQYNRLWIPDTLAGKAFNLTIKDSFSQIISGQQTITGGVNGKFWGPTLFFNKGDTVRLNVRNNLNDSTTLHWHGFHLPAVMDGGPHQIIPPNTLWQPFWKVTNDAATYWYHPHLHGMTAEHVSKGVGGFIIVRDPNEAALLLPRKYGIDDIPLALTDRRFTTNNQFQTVPFGDTMLVNGTLKPEYSVPAQVVRLRLLNAAIERSYHLGFSDNRNFNIIASDGGLLNTPVAVNRYTLHPGERIEILVNFTGQASQSFDLRAFNSELAANVPGGQLFTTGPLVNVLAKKDFDILHLNIREPIPFPITTIPNRLKNNVLLDSTNVNILRRFVLSDSITPNSPPMFLINKRAFNLDSIDFTIPLNNTEIWEISTTANTGHPFHVHDVQFNILTINGVPPAVSQMAWKDVVFIPAKQTVRLLAKFTDYADRLHPFMFHCHILTHEDNGMMGQFVVANPTMVREINNAQFSIYPNPTKDRVFVQFLDKKSRAYYVKIINSVGRVLRMLPSPDLNDGIDVSSLPTGVYFLQITEGGTKAVTVQKFIKN